MVSRRARYGLIIAGVLLGITGAIVLGALPADQGSQVSGPVTFNSSNGPAVNLTGDTNVSGTTLFPDANTVELNTTDGNITMTSPSPTSGRIDVGDITGTETVLTNLDVTSASMVINPEDKPAIKVGAGTQTIRFTQMTIGDGTRDFYYEAPSFAAAIEVRGVSADTYVLAVDSNGNILDATQSDSSGTATFSSLDSGSNDVYLVQNTAPEMSDPTPTGDLSQPPSQLQVNVSDADMPDGDTVTVDFYLDGSNVGTDSVSTNTTASTSISAPTAGEHEWYAVATDSSGESTTLATQTFRVPDTLFIRNETAPNQLVDNATVSMIWFGTDGSIQERQTSDGTINMTGLPPGDFYVSVNAPGYFDRTVYIDSLYVTQDVFLLNETVSSVETRFVLDDVSGQFDQSSRLVIERALNVSGNLSYRRVAADQFGAEGMQATLEQDVRYRLTIVAEDGTTQDLGPYRATQSETVTVVPGTPAVELQPGTDGWVTAADIDNDTITARYLDQENATSSLTITVYQRGNQSNVALAPTTYSNANDVSTAISLTANQTDKEWVVEFTIERNGETLTSTHIVSNQHQGTFSGMDGKWSTAIAIFILVIFAGAFSVINRAAGAIMVGLMGGLLWWFGWLAGTTTAAAITLYMFVAIIYSIYLTNRP